MRSSSQRRTRAIIISVSLLVAVIGGGAVAYKFRSQIKKPIVEWRAASHLKNAEKLIGEEEYEEALQLALSAHKMMPKSYHACQVVYRAAAGSQSPRILDYATLLYLHPDSTLEEKVEVLTLVQLMGDDLRFMALYNRMSPEQRENQDIVFLKTRYFATRGAAPAAWQLLEEYFEGGGTDERFKLLQSGLLLIPGLPEDAAERGQKQIVKLVNDKDEASIHAVRLLWGYPVSRIDPDLFPEGIEAKINELEGVAVREELCAVKISLARLKDEPQKQEELILQTVEKHREENLEPIVVWLTGLGRYDLVLNELDEEIGMRSLLTYDVRLKALAAVHGPEAAEKWLETPHPNSSELLVQLSAAKLAHAREDKIRVLDCFQRAFALADLDGNRKPYLDIYATAAELGDVKQAARALSEAAQRNGRAFPNSRQIGPVLGYFYNEGNFGALRYIFRSVAQNEPNNVSALNNFAYSSLVVGDSPESAIKISETLVEKHPQVVGLRSTLAFGLLKQEKYPEALEVISAEGLEWDNASPADIAIHALVLEMLKQKAEAEKLRKKVSADQLTAAERRAFLAIEQIGREDEEEEEEGMGEAKAAAQSATAEPAPVKVTGE